MDFSYQNSDWLGNATHLKVTKIEKHWSNLTAIVADLYAHIFPALIPSEIGEGQNELFMGLNIPFLCHAERYTYDIVKP